MQTTTTRFEQLAAGHVRPLSFQLRASFDKTFDPGVGFFTLSDGVTPMSLLDGPDLLAPSDNDVVQEWDKYNYLDYSDRVTQVEWQREEDVPYSVNLAMADVQLNNYDGLFTRGAGGPLDANLLPRRPFRVLAGFGGENLPQFVGLTDTVPLVDYSGKTASVHCQDFLSFLFGKTLDEAVMLQDVYTHEVLDYLFQLFGLLPSQYVLDEGFNFISFVYWEKGKNLGNAIRDLMQAEMGSLYMDELGMIRFRNRFKSSAAPVYSFDKPNIVEFSVSDQTTIINKIQIKAEVREVQFGEIIYNLGQVFEIPAGQSLEKFFDYEDPVTSVDQPVYTANSAADGSGSDLTSSVLIDSQVDFSVSSKIVFENTSGSTAYITSMTISGDPARVVKNIDEPFSDAASITAFEEQELPPIENNLIQSRDAARSLGLSLLNYFKDYNNTVELTVKGTYALQLGDNINVSVDNIDDVYTVTKIVNVISRAGDGIRYSQRLVARVFNTPEFFILSSDVTPMSLLDGDDVLAA